MVVYIDELFILNLVINYLLLHAAAILCGTQIRRLRILAGAALGALYACLVFLPALQPCYTLPAKVAFSLLMSLIAYGWHDWRSFLRRTLLFFTVSFAFAGAMMALFRLTDAPNAAVQNGVIWAHLSLPVLMAVSLGTYLLMTLLLRNAPKLSERGPARTPLAITLCGRTVELEAMVDTGNRLSDPLTNDPVVVVEYARIRDALPRDVRSILDVCGVADAAGTLRMLAAAELHAGFRLISFSAIGTARGLLLSLRAERVVTKDKTLEGALIALTQNDLSEETGCGAVIGA